MYNVLIVDDEALMRKALMTIVKGIEGFEVSDCVSSGEEAVKLCREKEIHIVFMDIALPGITGVEAAHRISKVSPATEIFVISVLGSFDVIRQTLTSKIRDYLVKPVSFSDIEQLLKTYSRDQEKDQSISLKMLKLYRDRKYQGMLKKIPEEVHEVFQHNQGNKELLTSKFMQIAGYILKEAVPYVYKDLDLGARFPVNEVFAGEEIAWVFWMTDVMDYIFRTGITHKHDYLEPVFEFIDNETKNDINLSGICEACNISQSYLSKLFRRYFDVSVMDYIHLRKLMKAKMYIVFTDLSMTQIGHHTGYNDGSYFSKVFKKYEGMSPKQFKKAFPGTEK